MIRLSRYALKFNKKSIFEDTDIFFEKGMLTVIAGESGSGKTTLLNSLMLENRFSGNYMIDDVDVLNSYTSDSIRSICYKIDQEPILIEELTVKENFSLYSNEFHKLDIHDSINKLNIEKLLDKYPRQLSSGERKRVAISLAMMRNPLILIIDEPTSNLDEFFSNQVHNLLMDYAHQGHYVIVSSHDQIMYSADMVFYIEKKKIILKETHVNNNDLYEQRNTNNIHMNTQTILKTIFYQLKKKKIVFNMKLIIVALFSLCITFNDKIIQTHNQIINDISSTEILVYKSNDRNTYSFANEEYPIEESEYKLLSQIDHINYINWRIDYEICYGDEYYKSTEKYSSDNFLIIDGNKKQKIFDDEKFDEFLSSTFYQNYDDSQVISEDKLLYKFNDDKGIYLTQEAAKMICDDIEMLRGKKLQIVFTDPSYNIDGASTVILDDGTEYQANTICGRSEIITLPISGILKQTGIYDNNSNNSIASVICLPQSIYEVSQKEYPYGTEDFDMYVTRDFSGKSHIYVGDIPDNEKSNIENNLFFSKWKPNAYTIKIDSLTNLDKVLNDIYDAGLDATCIYMDATSLRDSIDANRTLVKIVGIVILLYLLIVQWKTSKNKAKENMSLKKQLMNMGMTSKEIGNFFYKRQWFLFIMDSLICIVMTYLFVIVYNYWLFNIVNVQFDLMVIIILIMFIIDIIFYAMNRKKKLS